VSFSPDGRLALTGSLDRAATLWEVSTGRMVRRLVGHSEGVRSVCFSPDGRLALTGGADNTVILWDVFRGGIVRRLQGHTNDVLSVSFSPDGTLAVTGSPDGAAIFWDVETGEQRATMHNVKSGYLWMTPPTRNAPCGWLHTDREDLVSVFRTREESDEVEILADGDPDRKLYLEIYNRRDMVMNQINDRIRAKGEEVRISGYIDAAALETRIGIMRTQQRMLEDGKPSSGDDVPT
jgi:WD40 repeat protein